MSQARGKNDRRPLHDESRDIRVRIPAHSATLAENCSVRRVGRLGGVRHGRHCRFDRPGFGRVRYIRWWGNSGCRRRSLSDFETWITDAHSDLECVVDVRSMAGASTGDSIRPGATECGCVVPPGDDSGRRASGKHRGVPRISLEGIHIIGTGRGEEAFTGDV